MVGARLDAIDVQDFGQLFGCLPIQGINDATLAPVLVNELDHALDGLVLSHFGPDLIFEIGPVKR